MADKSLYKIMKTRLDVRKNTGFDYRKRMLIKTLDNNLFMNQTIRDFCLKVEDILNEIIYQIKIIKKIKNYRVDFDDDNIN